MTDDYAAVDPSRLAQAAAKLEDLRNALAGNVPKITAIMNAYGPPQVSLSSLRQAVDRAVIDAAGMRTRSNLAQKLLQSQTGLGRVSPKIPIPWDGTAVAAVSAQIDAFLLQSAEQNPDRQVALADIQAVADDIADHDGDLPYLTAFYNHAGPQVAQLASDLHDLNGSSALKYPQQFANAFSQQDQEILKTFAAGLALVDSTGSLQPSTMKQLTATSTLWSMGMLVKYGPSGAAWNTADPSPSSENFLAQLTRAEFTAEQNGTLRIPLTSTATGQAGVTSQELAPGLSQFDPLSVLLAADAQNQTAAMQVLGGPDGGKFADFMINNDGGLRYAPGSGNTPQYFTSLGPSGSPPNMGDQAIEFGLNQQVMENFLNAATSAPRGDSPAARQSAWAAVNIINNVPAPLIDEGKIGWQVSPEIRAALMNTFSRYMPDLAASASGAQREAVFQPEKGQPYVIGVGSKQLSAFLQEISLDKNAFVDIQAMASLAMGSSIGLVAKGGSIPGLASPDVGFAALYQRIGTEAANVGIKEAQQVDLRHELYNTMIRMAINGFRLAQNVTGNIIWVAVQGVVYAGYPAAPLFSTNNEASAAGAAATQQGTNELLAEVPLVRGLMESGALPNPPPADAFDANGNPTLKFGDWWSTHSNERVGNPQVGYKSLSDLLIAVQETMNVQGQAFASAPGENLNFPEASFFSSGHAN